MLSEEEIKKLKGVFLEAYLKYGKFTAACNRVSGENQAADESDVANWLEHDEDFKLEFEKVARAVERANALKAQDFLNEAGQGKKKKDDGITNANVVAAHMVLEAWDKRKWGQKVPEEKQGTKEISVIIKNYGRDERKVNVIDAPEVKLLPDGTDES